MKTFNEMHNDIHHKEKIAIKRFLRDNIATLYKVSYQLKIALPVVCLHKQELAREGKLIILFIDKCDLTGEKAGHYTCNLNLVNFFKSACQ